MRRHTGPDQQLRTILRQIWRGVVLALLTVSPAAAQDSPLPERRAITVSNIDFFGGDIRSIYDTGLEDCAVQCRDTPRCTAFTYNTGASACFLKDEYERSEAFDGAVSANLVAADPEQIALAKDRAAVLDFLRPARLREARAFAERSALEHPVNFGAAADPATAAQLAIEEGDLRRAAALRASAVTRDDTAKNWTDYSRSLLEIEPADYSERFRLNDSALFAAINAWLRAGTEAEQREALLALAEALDRSDRGRDTIRALKLAQATVPDAQVARSLEEARRRHGFRVLDHEVASDAADPKLCVRFSEPLASEGTDYEPFVRIAGADLPVEAQGRQLCVTGVEHGKRYRLTLRAGLPAAEEGEALLDPVTLDLYVRDRAPAARFSGRAYVLPKTAEAAIPVTTVNTDSVDLSIYRIGDRNLLRAIQERLFAGDLDGYTAQTVADRLGEAVWKGVGEVQTRLNEDVVTRLPVAEAIGAFEPGVYAITADIPGNTQRWQDLATQWFIVTDLGLATTSASDGLHVFARGLSDAGPEPGVTLELLAQNNSVLGTATTDASGHAVFPAGLARGGGSRAPALITARKTEDFAFLDLNVPPFDLSDRGVEGRPAPGPVDVFLATERGAYRPGESVHATILARDARALAVEDLPLTAIVTRPDGVEFLRRVLADEGAGGRALSFALGEAPMRGGWQIAIHTDPQSAALAEEGFLVEDFLPERIAVSLDAPDGPVSSTQALPVDLRAEYLYGAAAGGLAVEGEARVRAADALDAHPGYRFGLADDTFQPRVEPLAPGTVTAEDGTAEVSLFLPGDLDSTLPLEVEALIRVRDGGGRPVERRLTRPVAATQTRIGAKPGFDGVVEQGGKAEFDLIAIAPDGSRAALERGNWTLSRIETRYQWYRLDGRWDYEPITTRTRIDSGDIAIGADDPAALSLPVDWGRYELKLSAEGAAPVSLAFTAGWYAPVAGSGTPDLLQVALDAERYDVGDTATLRIEARHAGRALVQVVDDRLIAMQAVEIEEGENSVVLDVTEDWGAGAYVVATLLRPMDVEAGRNPSRALGLAWAPVDAMHRTISVAFTGTDEAKPRGPLDASVQLGGLEDGERAFVTVAAVDAGVLGIPGFEPPEPEAWYFGQRALGVEFRDLYGRLIDGLSGTRGRIRSGGGAQLGMASPPPVEDIVARFSGVVQADEDGTAAISFDIPDFNGTVRLMAIAWSGRSIGSATRDVLVRDPVVLSVTAPRFLAPGDESRVLLDIAHAFGPAGTVEVSLEADAELDAELERRELVLEDGGHARIEIPVQARAVGDPELRIVLKTPEGEQLAKSARLPVRANDPDILRRSTIPLAAEGGSFMLDTDTYAGLVPGTGRATMVLGPLAQFDVAGLLNQLDLYPYGCTEQLTSRALPLLAYPDVARTLGLLPPGAGVGTRIEGAVAKILANQAPDGGFGLWRAASGDFWLDAYVTDFLSRAREAGFAVPGRAFEAALGNLRNRVAYAGDFDRGGEDLAYALMVLAREGTASIGDLRYYADTKSEAFGSPLAQAQLGAALAFYGDQPRADRLFRLAGRAAVSAKPEAGWRSDYGTTRRDAAGVLALAAGAGSEAVNREALIRRIVPGDDDRSYRSTQEKVWTLLAAEALIETGGGGAVTIDGAPVSGAVIDINALSVRERAIRIDNTGDEPLDARLTVIGKPTEPQPASGNGYSIERRYYTLEGDEADPAKVTQNTRLVVVLEVTSERSERARLMVDDPLPAGFEIETPSLLRSGDLEAVDWLGETAAAEYAAFQSDRFLAALDFGKGSFRLAYLLRAVSPGSFHHPSALVEDMYRPEFRARTATGTVLVAAAQ